MERPQLYLYTLVLLNSMPALSLELDASWHQAKQRDGVTVYIREVEGSQIAEALAITHLDASLSAVTTLILDVNNNHRWIDSVDQSRVVKQVSERESINYTISYAPWPVSDRDAVVRTRMTQNTDDLTVIIRSEGLPDFRPREAGMVRVEAISSSWQLTPQPEGGVEVRYQVHSEPGGKLPSWLVNAIATEQPLNTLRNMRRAVASPPYVDASTVLIIDPGSMMRK